MNRGASIVTIAAMFGVVILFAIFYGIGRTDLVAGTLILLGLSYVALLVIRLLRRETAPRMVVEPAVDASDVLNNACLGVTYSERRIVAPPTIEQHSLVVDHVPDRELGLIRSDKPGVGGSSSSTK